MAGPDGRSRVGLQLVGKPPEIGFYAQRAAAKGGPVLVLGCAQGKLCGELAEAGLSVTGVDPSARMIASAEDLRSSRAPEVAARIQLLEADLRTVRLPQQFPSVLAPANALGLGASLDELDAILLTVRHHLAPGGMIAFDVWNLAPAARLRAEDQSDPTAPLEPNRPIFTPHLRERGAGGLRRLKLRAFTPREVDAALSRVGLVALERFGGFDGHPAEGADALQVVVASEP